MHCPECGSCRLRVVMTAHTEHGQTVRRRRCEICAHRWYTLQPPEALINSDQPQWVGKGNTQTVIAQSV